MNALRLTAIAVAGLAANTAWSQAGVAVGHLAPFADEVDATSVTVLANDAPLLENFVFGDFTDDYVEVPAGDYTLDVVPTGTDTVAITLDVTLEDGVNYTVIATGDGTNQPLVLLPLVDTTDAPDAGNLNTRIVHAAPFAPTLEGTEVSIRTDGGDIVNMLTGVPFGVDSGFFQLPGDTYDLKVSSNDGNTNFIDIAPTPLPAGVDATVFAYGDGVNQPLAVRAWVPGVLNADLPLEIPVTSAQTGWWVPIVEDTGMEFGGQGVVTLVIPSEDRMVGTVYTYTADGMGQAWFTFDSCGNDAGVVEGCANPGNFTQDSVSAVVYNTTGGTLLTPGETTSERIGLLDIDFAAGCTEGDATLTLDADPMNPVAFPVQRVEAPLSCNLTE